MRRNLLAACILLLAACAHTGSSQSPCVRPALGLQYCLLPPAAMTLDETAQLVHVQGTEFEQYFVSRIAIVETPAESRLVMNASSLLGQPLFEIRYVERDGTSEVTLQPESAPVKPVWLLALLQIAEADIDDVRAALAGATVADQAGARMLLDKQDAAVVTIRTSPNGKIIEIPSQQLTVRTRKLDTETIAQ